MHAKCLGQIQRESRTVTRHFHRFSRLQCSMENFEPVGHAAKGKDRCWMSILLAFLCRSWEKCPAGNIASHDFLALAAGARKLASRALVSHCEVALTSCTAFCVLIPCIHRPTLFFRRRQPASSTPWYVSLCRAQGSVTVILFPSNCTKKAVYLVEEVLIPSSIAYVFASPMSRYADVSASSLS